MGQHWSHVQGNRKEGAGWRLLDWTQRVVLEFVLLRQVLSLPHGQDGSHICFVLLWFWQSSSLPRLALWFAVLLQGVRWYSPQSPPHFPLQVQRTALPGLRHSFQWGISFSAPAVAPWWSTLMGRRLEQRQLLDGNLARWTEGHQGSITLLIDWLIQQSKAILNSIIDFQISQVFMNSIHYQLLSFCIKIFWFWFE